MDGNIKQTGKSKRNERICNSIRNICGNNVAVPYCGNNIEEQWRRLRK
jgi:hypothetical protein